ncbi:MAG: glycosyltransferase [Pyrinomonadaceae bacterium]|nr:glycosyltransferase [Pyrinomonadaceae bacterium]
MSTLLNPSTRPRDAELETSVSAPAPLPWMQALRHRRVLHVGKFYPPHMGGMETHLQALCEELQDKITVEVLVAGDERRTREDIIGVVKVTRVGTALNLSAAPVCPAMTRKIREAGADLVHMHLPNPTAILAYLASKQSGRLIFTYHSDIIRQKMLSRAFRPFLRRALTRADAIIVGSPNYLESSSVLQEFKEKCRVIPFGIPFEDFQRADAAEVSEIRRRYGSRIVLGVGRLVYYKGFEYLIRAMREVRGHLLIIGGGPLLGALEREAEACGLAERVTFLTDVKDVRPYYHAADVFALSSIARSEAFGLVQLEAMACGVPVVNTKLDSGVPFVSQDGVTGLTVPPADAQALAQAINGLLDDAPQRAKFGEAGRRRVEQEFSLETMTRRTLELYAEVLAMKH